MIVPVEQREQHLQRLKEQEEAERQRVLDLAREDMRKELDAALTDLHQEANKNQIRETLPITRTLARFGSLLGVLSRQASGQAKEAAEISKDNLAVQGSVLEGTRKVERLTVALIWLTAALLLFTVYLSIDAYLKSQRDNKAEHHQSEPDQSNLETHHVTVPY